MNKDDHRFEKCQEDDFL